MVRSIPLTVCALLLAFAPGEALARPTVAVVTPASRGRGAARVARGAQAALAKQLRKKGVRVVTVRGRKARALRRCLRKSRCARRRLQRLDVDHIVAGAVRRRGRRFVVSLRLLDEDGRTVARERLRTRGRVNSRRLLASFGRASSQHAAAAGVPQSQVHDGEDPPL